MVRAGKSIGLAAAFAVSAGLLFGSAYVFADEFEPPRSSELGTPRDPLIFIVDGDSVDRSTLIDCFISDLFLPLRESASDAEISALSIAIGSPRSILAEVSDVKGQLSGFTLLTAEAEDGARLCVASGGEAWDLEFRFDSATAFVDAPVEQTRPLQPPVAPLGPFLIVGQHDGSVTDIALRGLDESQQRFTPFGSGWYVLEYLDDESSVLPSQIDIELDDGTVLTHSVSSLEVQWFPDEPCDTACLEVESADTFRALEADVIASGAEQVARILQDGMISGDEYRVAESSFVDCLEASGVAFNLPLVLQAESDAAESTIACYQSQLRPIDQARFAQAAVTDSRNSDRLVAVAEFAPESFEIVPLTPGEVERLDQLREQVLSELE